MVDHFLKEKQFSMKHGFICVVLLIAAAVVLAGCGGGGGGNPAPPPVTDNFVLTGTVKDFQTGVAVVGAKVTVGSTTANTNSQGKFSLGFSSRPMATTYSVDGSKATPAPGYYTSWAKVDGVQYDAMNIDMPVAPAGGMDMGVIYLQNSDSAPPPPVSH